MISTWMAIGDGWGITELGPRIARGIIVAIGRLYTLLWRLTVSPTASIATG
jgi:hypothetical protein